jgi:hypothetical protein
MSGPNAHRAAALAALLLLAPAGCGVVDDSPPPVRRVDPPGSPGKIDLSRPGSYFCGRWQYVIGVRNRGYGRELLHGSLFLDGRPVVPGEDDAGRETPWGPMRFHRYEAPVRDAVGWIPAEASDR